MSEINITKWTTINCTEGKEQCSRCGKCVWEWTYVANQLVCWDCIGD